jgi:hypothetical protein
MGLLCLELAKCMKKEKIIRIYLGLEKWSRSKFLGTPIFAELFKHLAT